MGQTIALAKEQTSAKEGTKGKLELSPVNEDILNKIVNFAEGFPAQNKPGSEIEFKTPLKWQTELRPSNFSGGEYNVKDGNVESTKTGHDGSPLLLLREKSADNYEISVASMELVAQVLQASGENKINEAKTCLEENPDPVAIMMGDRFAIVDGQPDNATFRYFEEISRTGAAKEDDEDASKETEEKKTILQMVLALREFDSALMKEYTKLVANEVRLTPKEVDRQVDLVRQYAGDYEDKHVVKGIRWCEPYTFVFANGCRAYPKRQFHGDISYVQIEPHDTETLYITASTNGWYINKGYNEDSKELNYDKVGDFYKHLVVLLRDKSPKFDELIDQQSWQPLTEKRKVEESRRNQTPPNVAHRETADLEDLLMGQNTICGKKIPLSKLLYKNKL